MEPWHLIANDHANIASLCSDILRTTPGAGAISRERLFDELDGELRRHLEAEQDSLYEALEDHARTERLIDELEDEHDEIAERLGRLARARDKGGRQWTQEFEDFSYLLDRHFHREEHQLLPVAREILDAGQIRTLRHEFAEEKIEALRQAREGLWGGIRPACWRVPSSARPPQPLSSQPGAGAHWATSWCAGRCDATCPDCQ